MHLVTCTPCGANMVKMVSSAKAVAIYFMVEEIATGIQSVETIANRCWRKKVISDRAYKQVLRPHLLPDSANRALLRLIEASIREEDMHFEEFFEILGDELPPQIAKDVISKITYHLKETHEHTNLKQCTKDDVQNETNEKEAADETSDTTQNSKDSNLLG